MSFSIINVMRSSFSNNPKLFSFKKAMRNSAIALGLCVLGISSSGRKLKGLRFNAWVRTRRGSRKSKKGRDLNILLLRASYGS